MISRNWKGVVKPEEADNYITHLKTVTFPQLAEIKGFIKASILKKETTDGVEFTIVTEWETMRAIKEFAGEKPELAVVPEKIKAMMVEYDKTVDHYEIVYRVLNI